MADLREQASGTSSLQDQGFMNEALELAARIPQRPWPNPPVGAVVVADGKVVGRGAHHGAGQLHAERVALAEAGALAQDATLYCTLEPCHHHGRTPPCTAAVLASGVRRLVMGMRDPNPIAAGGAAALIEAGIEVVTGVNAGACLDLVWPFVATDAFSRPYIELKTAVSLDGFFTRPVDPVGRPQYLTGPEARADVHRRRRWVDLVLVGQGTARQDSPRLDTRLVPADAACPAAEPQAACVAGRQGSAALSRGQWLLFSTDESAGEIPAGAEVISCAGDGQGIDVVDLVQQCTDRGLMTIMVEGGPRLARAFLEKNLIDRWIQYTAPVICGGGQRWPDQEALSLPAYHLTRSQRLGADSCTVWDREDFQATLQQVTRPAEVH